MPAGPSPRSPRPAGRAWAADERVDQAGTVKVLDRGRRRGDHSTPTAAIRRSAARRGPLLRRPAAGRCSRHAPRHQLHRQADRRPHPATLKPRCAGRVRFHLLLLTVLGPIVSLRPVRHGKAKDPKERFNQQFFQTDRTACPRFSIARRPPAPPATALPRPARAPRPRRPRRPRPRPRSVVPPRRLLWYSRSAAGSAPSSPSRPGKPV